MKIVNNWIYLLNDWIYITPTDEFIIARNIPCYYIHRIVKLEFCISAADNVDAAADERTLPADLYMCKF